jgi:integrase
MSQSDTESVVDGIVIASSLNDLPVAKGASSRKHPGYRCRYPRASSGKGSKTPTLTEKSVPGGLATVAGFGAAKEAFVWDSDLPGFGVRTYGSGEQAYIIQYRERGRTRRRVIGKLDDMSRRTAFRAAKKLLTTVDTHHKVVDPFQIGVTTEPVTLAQFAPRHLELADQHWKPATLRTNRDALDRLILPVLGHLRLDQIERHHVIAWRDSLSSRPATANRALPVLSGLMKAAEFADLRRKQSNPCARMKRFKTKKHMRFLYLSEVERLGMALVQFGAVAPADCDMIELALLIGARGCEVTGLRFEEIDPPFLFLADSKNGPSTRFIGARAAALVDRWRQKQPDPANARGYVFDTSGKGRRPRIDYTIWNAIRQAAGIPDVRLHDLRHTFASHAVMNGVGLPTLSRLLGHALLESTEIYAHLADANVREASNRVSGRIARLTNFANAEAVQ